MNTKIYALVLGLLSAPCLAQAPDPVATLVGRLDLEKYKATIKGLTAFGDRRQGTERNRKAVDWIEAQLKSYGCSNVERLHYTYTAPPETRPRNDMPMVPTIASGEVRNGVGGSRYRGITRATGVNTDPNRQPDEKLRELDREPAVDGPRDEVYCTKVGTTHPDEMYIVGGHMDGHGWGEAANDNGSGTALVMELARVFSLSDVKTDRSIRFVLWNNEETGLNGAKAYVEQRAALQGIESPKGSGKYPEPRWLAMIQHDMMMWDHGMPRADGSWNPEQRPEADVNIEFQSKSKFADAAMKLGFFFRDANEKYATDYPAAVGPHMTNTDSTPFMDLVPALSLRENERGMQTGAGWNPTWHQPEDVYSMFSDKDFRLGLNAAQTTLGAVGQLAGATIALAAGYSVRRQLAIGGAGRWDLLAVDSARHHLFLSRSDHVDIVDTVSGERIGTLAGTDGVHGIAIAPGLMRGYATNGRAGTVTEFDLSTFARLRDIPVSGQSPDAVLFDQGSGRLFVFNASSNNASVIDPALGKEIATIAFEGNPELPADDGHGHIFVNVEDKAQLVRIDADTMKILDTWPLPGCEEPSGLALDVEHARLLSTCQNQVAIVTDAGDGHQVAQIAIGEGPDGASFDAQRLLAFIPSGKSGSLTLVHEDDPDHFRVVQTLTTQASARTIALDPQTHRLYLPAARFEPKPEGSKERPPMVTDSFTVLEVGDGR